MIDKEYVQSLSIDNIILAIKEKEIFQSVTTWTGLEAIILSEIDKERQVSHDLTYIWNLKTSNW